MTSFIEEHKKLIRFVVLFIGVFLVVATMAKLKEYRYIGSNTNNTITVTGTGTVDRMPDTAKISFTIQDEQKELKLAQNNVSTKIDAVTAALKAIGIEEKYIKTDSYTSYPQYDYADKIVCMGIGCPQPGTPVLRGYQVSHSITVNVKVLDTVPQVLGALGDNGVTNISGPTVGFEDDKEVAREARDIAITDARAQAKSLAKSLGVRLVRVVSFSEQGGGYPIMYARDTAMNEMKAGSAPTVPIGEENISATVTIVYEIQ